MNDKQIVENIVCDIAKSFSGTESTKHWTNETIWFDAAPYASVGVEKAKKVFDEAFGNLKSCDVTILDMRTFINGNSALVCSVGYSEQRRSRKSAVYDTPDRLS